MSTKEDLKEQSDSMLNKIRAFFGNRTAKEALQKREEDRIIKKYFGAIVVANANKNYRKDSVMSDKELRQHAQRIIQLENQKNLEGIQNYVKGVCSLANKKELDEKILLSERSGFLAFCHENDRDFKKYDKLQEYASFGHYAAVSSLGKDYLEKFDNMIETTLNAKDLKEFRKQYGGKSFSEIYKIYRNDKNANTQKKQMDNQRGADWAGVYR